MVCYYQLMQCTYYVVLHRIQMETEMIDKLDVFISGGMGDGKYRAMLYQM